MERSQPRRVITRNRELRACTECRRRKLKCDRKAPCSTCVRREAASECYYESKEDDSLSERDRRLRAEARLEHLERLVQDLSQPQQGSSSHDDRTIHSIIAEPSSGGDGARSDFRYSGATHWSAMLEDIDELRTAIQQDAEFDDADSIADSDSDDRFNTLFGKSKPLSFQAVLSQFLPTRQEADRLVASYFRAKAVAVPFIHSAQFNRLYRHFWDHPTSAPPLWTSILFSILDIAAETLSNRSGQSSGKDRSGMRFYKAAAYCLVIGDYNKPQRFAVESLLLLIHSACLVSADLSLEIATVSSILVRVATIMGYHREPTEARITISAFEAEMRRRTWSVCMQLDLLISFQLGLPSNIQYPTWDTKPPTNLLDADFNEGTTELPPPRPDTEPTEVLFYIAKHKLMAIFEKIIRYTLTATEGTIEELMQIDTELEVTYYTLPSIFHTRSMADSIVDPPSVIVSRLCVSFIHLKSICVLHRRQVLSGQERSIAACYDAAIKLVTLMLDIYKELEPGGQLESERWFTSSITWHDFLIGCSTLCLVVCATESQPERLDQILRHQQIQTSLVLPPLALLQAARDLCATQYGRSSETQRVGRLLEATLQRFSKPVSPSSNNQFSVRDLDEMVLGSPPPEAPHEEEIDWWWNNNSSLGLDADAWKYMEELLDLPNE